MSNNFKDKIQMEVLGRHIASVLYLKKNKDGYYDTDYGTFSDEGLGRFVKRSVENVSAE